jgi:hypothetical protein
MKLEEDDIEIIFYGDIEFNTPIKYTFLGKGVWKMSEARQDQLNAFAVTVMALYIDTYNKTKIE